MDRNDVYDAIAQAQGNRFFGKYRAEAVSNLDPESRGRLQVRVPEVLGENVIVWALPSAPFAGNGVGFFTMPPIGANIWVEFEAGNLKHPIWSGCFWAKGEIAAADALPDVIFLKTKTAMLRIDDLAGEVKIEASGATITLSPGEIKIQAPQITSNANGGQTKVTAIGFDAQQGAFKVI